MVAGGSVLYEKYLKHSDPKAFLKGNRMSVNVCVHVFVYSLSPPKLITPMRLNFDG